MEGTIKTQHGKFDVQTFTTQYSRLMPDAFLKGHLNLDLPVTDELLNAERPYDPSYRAENNISFYMDCAYFKGKYYSYFGVAPVVLLFLPYKVLTGLYLPTPTGVFIFCSLAILFLLLLWSKIVKCYMKKIPFVMYLLGAIALFTSSNILLLLRTPNMYEIPISSALMFCSLGLYLTVKYANSKEIKERYRCKTAVTQRGALLFFAAFSFALAVACRPTSVFVSILLFVFLLQKKNKNDFVVAAIPYILVAIPLMWYNYARFGSVFDFGVAHQLTIFSQGAINLLNPLGLIVKTLCSLCVYFFNPLSYGLHFPFVETQRDYLFPGGMFVFYESSCGLINFPVIWILCKLRSVLPLIKSEKKMLLSLALAMPLLGFLIACIVSLVAGITCRYSVEFAWLFTIPSLICAYFWYNNHLQQDDGKEIAVLKVVYVSCAVTILTGLFLSIKGYGQGWGIIDDNIYEYLRQAFSII